MEIRKLAKDDLDSLIDLYRQLQPGDMSVSRQRAEEGWGVWSLRN